jgi:hypothetical protein
MKGFVDNSEKLIEENDFCRRVHYTGHNLELVLMTIQQGEEAHDDRDRFSRKAKAKYGSKTSVTG